MLTPGGDRDSTVLAAVSRCLMIAAVGGCFPPDIQFYAGNKKHSENSSLSTVARQSRSGIGAGDVIHLSLLKEHLEMVPGAFYDNG